MSTYRHGTRPSAAHRIIPAKARDGRAPLPSASTLVSAARNDSRPCVSLPACSPSCQLPGKCRHTGAAHGHPLHTKLSLPRLVMDERRFLPRPPGCLPPAMIPSPAFASGWLAVTSTARHTAVNFDTPARHTDICGTLKNVFPVESTRNYFWPTNCKTTRTRFGSSLQIWKDRGTLNDRRRRTRYSRRGLSAPFHGADAPAHRPIITSSAPTP